MKAIRIAALGRPLVAAGLAKPVPVAGEVLVAVQAAGICHSDAHYRSGTGALAQLPITPGHEVSGVIESVGPGVSTRRIGQRVCLHYLVSCGDCGFCRGNIAQFCPSVAMIGKDRDGGYAEFICVPEVNAIVLPDAIPFTHAAVMMCSYATALHALRKARFTEGESVAVFGAGGLGMAAIGLAGTLGASLTIAVDVNPAKLRAAEALGATAIDASKPNVAKTILETTGGFGVDVALELVGLPATAAQALQSLGVQGRAAMVGLASETTPVNTYRDLIGMEREIVGVSDHLPEEIDELLELAQNGRLDIAPMISETVPLDAKAINQVFDRLDSYSGNAIRTVIQVGGEA